MSMDNSLKSYIRTSDGSEIYLSDVEAVFDEALENLIGEDEKVTPPIFAGCLKEVYIRLFKPSKNMPHNANTTIDLADIQGLDELWTTYTRLCYRHRITPTILRFSIMTGVTRDTFANWSRGDYRSSAHSDTYKKWMSESESAVVDKITESNSVGAIFIAKSCFNYRETAPVALEEQITPKHDSPETIAERHKYAQLPEKPEL